MKLGENLYKLMILFVLVCGFISQYVSAEENTIDPDLEIKALDNLTHIENRLENLERLIAEENISLKERVSNLRSEIESIVENTVAIEENIIAINNKNTNIESELYNATRGIKEANISIEDISIAWSKSSSMAKLGALILLCGLLIEIVGATVLAGTHLISKQENVYTLKSTPPSLDLHMNDVNIEPRINFLGSLASVLLFSGFVLQFSGTILVFSLPSWLTVIMVALAIIPGALIIYYLLGQSYNQTRSEKFKVVCNNIKRNFLPELGLKCDFCSNRVSRSEAMIWWQQEDHTKEHPYLHAPYHMHVGHSGCLEESEYYKDKPVARPEFDREKTVKVTLDSFNKDAVPKLRKWWSKYRVHWAEKRNSDESISNSEYKFEELIKRVGS